MVVDYKLFSPGAELPPGVLYVSEQIPGLVVFGDITQELGMPVVWSVMPLPHFCPRGACRRTRVLSKLQRAVFSGDLPEEWLPVNDGAL